MRPLLLQGGRVIDPSRDLDRTTDLLVQDGKVHYLGVSNFEAWQLGWFLALGAERRLARVTVVQPRYNLLNRVYERDLLPLCRAAGIGVVPYNPLGAGMLTGKYHRGQEPPEGSRFALGDYGRMYQKRYWNETMFDVVEAVGEIATELSVTPAQIAVAWLLAQPDITAPLVGASRPEQLRDTVGALEVRLPEAALRRLDEASSPFR